MNAAQRRLARRQVLRDWPKGLIVTSLRFDGLAHVVGYSKYSSGYVEVKGERGKIVEIHPRQLRPAPNTPVSKALQAAGDSMVRGTESLGKFTTTVNDARKKV